MVEGQSDNHTIRYIKKREDTMSRVERARQSVDGTLDRWQIRAEAMEAHLNVSEKQAMERVEAVKKSYLDNIDKVKAGIAKSKSLADAEKQRLQTRLDEARVQFALGKAETEDEFNKQCMALKSGLAQLEREVDADLAAIDEEDDEFLDQAVQDLVDGWDAVDAEMDAMTVKFQTMKMETTAGAEAKIAQAKNDLAAFKKKISVKRADASEKVQTFSSEFDKGWEQIKAAFKSLE